MPPKNTKKRQPTNASQTNEMLEKKFVAIEETDPDIARKTKILWVSVTLLSLVVIAGWLVMLRANINSDKNKFEFLSLVKEISDSVSEFDSQIKKNNPEIDINELGNIKNEIIGSLQQNIDSSLWPTRQIDELGISIQYPQDWIATVDDGVVRINSSETSSTRITIASSNNAKKEPLASWIEKNSPDALAGYEAKEPIFKFNATASETLAYYKNQGDASLDAAYLINSTSTQRVYIIKAATEGDKESDKKILEEIVKTIKIIK